MIMKIDQISRENIKLCHGTEYILIDDFFDVGLFTQLHNKFLLDYVIKHDFGDICSLSGHPLVDELFKQETKILNAVNTVWQETCIENKASATLMKPGKKLNIHNDSHWETVPIRGVLYLNDVCGTTFHSSIYADNPIEIGGKANQLLLFKVTENSFHSVGLYDHEEKDRFAIVMMFDRTKDQQ